MNGRAALLLTAVAWLALGAGLGVWAIDQAPGWLGALAAGGVEFAHPERLPLLVAVWLVPLLALGAIADLPRWQVALTTVMRMAGIAALVIALAVPRSRQETPRSVSVVHLVDRSSSMPAISLAAAVSAITADVVAHRADPDAERAAVHVVAFGAEPQRLPWPPTETAADQPLPPLEIAAATTEVSADGGGSGGIAGATDIESALDLALGMLDPGRVGHVVVWSDGVENRGDARRMLQTLRRGGLVVHRGALGQLAAPSELLVESAIVPPRVRANLPVPVALLIRSTSDAKVSCSGVGDDVKLGPVEATVSKGSTRVELGRARWKTAGAHELALRCEVVQGEDRFRSNNALHVRVVVHARPKVLYVEGTPASARVLARVLEDDFDLTVRGPDGLPRDADALRGFDAVIVSDLARITAAGVPQVGDAEQKALGAYVERGGGVLFVGGQDALGSGGWQGSWLDKNVLPVKLEVDSTEEEPSIALMLVLDRSGSMAGPKMDLAKEAARATAEALGHEDRLGVIAFDNIPRAIVPLQRAGNRYRIATRIDGIAPGGGTHIYPALQMAATDLEHVRAKVKHVILLSDGQAPRNGIDALVRQMRRSGVTVTAVGVGDEVDRGLLEVIADRGGGRAYFTDRPENLPRIFVRETKQIAGETVVERKVKPKRAPNLGRVDMLRGVDLDAAPSLRGFLTSKPKRGAEEILRVSSGEPLLVRWRLGLGKVAVWTSDLKNRWAQDWIDCPGYAVLSRQLVRDVLLEDLAGEAQVRLAREDDRLRVIVDAILDDAPVTGLLAEGTLRAPTGPAIPLALAEVAPGRYEATAPMRIFGPYDVEVELRAAADQPVLLRGRASLSRPYPDELRLAPAGSSSVDELVAATNGSAAATAHDWHQRGNATWRSWQPLWPTLVALALALLLVDVLLRRVRLGPARPGSWFDRRGL